MSSVPLLAGPNGSPRIIRAGASATFRGVVYDMENPEEILPGLAIITLEWSLYEPDFLTIINGRTDVETTADAVGDIEIILEPADNPLVGKKISETHYLQLDYTYSDGVNTLTGIQQYAMNVEGVPQPTVTVVEPTPVDADGNLTIIHGDDYDDTIRKVPQWTVPDYWADISGATAEFSARGTSGSIDMTGLTVDATENTITMPLTAADTQKWQSASDYRYDVQVTYPSGLIKTLTYGQLIVLDTYTEN
jgi:hypothetical protein